MSFILHKKANKIALSINYRVVFVLHRYWKHQTVKAYKDNNMLQSTCFHQDCTLFSMKTSPYLLVVARTISLKFFFFIFSLTSCCLRTCKVSIHNKASERWWCCKLKQVCEGLIYTIRLSFTTVRPDVCNVASKAQLLDLIRSPM